jgi:hypothetical protein
MAGITRSEADAHKLIAIEPLLTSQTAYRSMIKIGRDTAWCLDGWFHKFLEKGFWSGPKARLAFQ